MKFYSKFKKNKYTTIRRYKKGNAGDIVLEQYPNGFHYARIKDVVRETLERLPTKFLLDDTDCKTRDDAYYFIQCFYKKPIDPYNEKLYIYFMEKIEGDCIEGIT